MTADDFLEISSQFRLGDLPTEQPHPETTGLAEWAQNDLPQAVAAFHRVDTMALNALKSHLGPLPELVKSLQTTLLSGNRIFLAGCGATGRLALVLETIARQEWLEEDPETIIGFMAGGDAALIRSIESFEDHPEYGARQLRELGFSDGDLLIGITEGGETPFVIGATLEATRFNGPDPWFLFCNPREILIQTVQRSKEVLTHRRVRSFPLPIGPMALSGSTRLQATTVQMLVMGAALAEACTFSKAEFMIERFTERLENLSPEFLIPFIEAEAEVYQGGGQVLYRADLFAITILTDTTERSPTFSLPPFESRDHPDEASSPCYLSIPQAPDSQAAWLHILGRAPRALNWEGLTYKASLSYLLSHDISREAAGWRKVRSPECEQVTFDIFGLEPSLEFSGHRATIGLPADSLLIRHLLLKVCLNMHSTLVMGRLGRFESNLMTRVKPANNKLIDRAARYLQNKHMQQNGDPLPYEAAVRRVFADMDS